MVWKFNFASSVKSLFNCVKLRVLMENLHLRESMGQLIEYSGTSQTEVSFEYSASTKQNNECFDFVESACTSMAVGYFTTTSQTKYSFSPFHPHS